MHNFDRLFLMPFDEVYLLEYLIYYYERSIPMVSNQTRRQQIPSLSFLIYEYLYIMKFSLKDAISCSLGCKYLLHEYQNPSIIQVNS